MKKSTVPGTKTDVEKLTENFERTLARENALETGFCPVRRRIYDELFRESIRLSRVECSERGQLLDRIRDEFLRWFEFYQNLYCSASAYGIRQNLYRAEEKKNFQFAVEELENECQTLADQLNKEKHRLELLTKNLNEKSFRAETQFQRQRKEIEHLKFYREQLKRDLNSGLTEILTNSALLLTEQQILSD